jgi:hypothetical protein
MVMVPLDISRRNAIVGAAAPWEIGVLFSLSLPSCTLVLAVATKFSSLPF